MLIALESPINSEVHHRNRIFLHHVLSKIPKSSILRIVFHNHFPFIDFYTIYYSDLLTLHFKRREWKPNVLILLNHHPKDEKIDWDIRQHVSTLNKLCDENFDPSTLPDSGIRSVFPMMKESFQQFESIIKKYNVQSGNKTLKFDVIHGKYKRIASGGTFDRMHMGHYLLLTYQCMLYLHDDKEYTSSCIVGLTEARDLLKNKTHAELIAPYEEREAAVAEILKELCPESMNVNIAKLTDPFGPTITDPLVSAIVVSEETIAGANKINEIRKSKNMKELEVFVVPCIQSRDQHQKMSSTHLREIEAEGR